MIYNIYNFIHLDNFEAEDKIKLIKNEKGEETGFEVAGTLTTFDVKNENGLTFARGSYDKFVDRYYSGNAYNIPVCLLHDDTDVRHLCGIVRTLEKTEEGVKVVAYIPRSAYYYNLIKSQIREGILQGFSNCGSVVRIEDTEAGDKIADFNLLHVALVPTPADTGAKFENTIIKGFSKNEEKIDPLMNLI